jgi:cysteine desulfuration protein SufE
VADWTKYNEFVEALELIDDEEMRIEYILDVAKRRAADPLPEAEKTEANFMHGCMAKVWITHQVRDGKHYFKGDSDALVVRGLVTMMTESFSGFTAEEIAGLTLDHVRKLNLGALTTQRQVGMMAMLKHLQKLSAEAPRAATETDDGRRQSLA